MESLRPGRSQRGQKSYGKGNFGDERVNFATGPTGVESTAKAPWDSGKKHPIPGPGSVGLKGLKVLPGDLVEL